MAAPLSPNLPWSLMNPILAQALNPVLSNAIIQGELISNISLTANTPKTINHGLNRMMQGWFVIDNTASSNIWRTSSLNTKTITLESSATTTISLWVF